MSELKNRRDLYQEVTDKIVKSIEDGGMASWVRPWSDLNEPGLPKNGASARQYSGVNTALLFITAHERGYGSNRWFTMKQANEAGGRVRKGEYADGKVILPKPAILKSIVSTSTQVDTCTLQIRKFKCRRPDVDAGATVTISSTRSSQHALSRESLRRQSHWPMA